MKHSQQVCFQINTVESYHPGLVDVDGPGITHFCRRFQEVGSLRAHRRAIGQSEASGCLTSSVRHHGRAVGQSGAFRMSFRFPKAHRRAVRESEVFGMSFRFPKGS